MCTCKLIFMVLNRFSRLLSLSLYSLYYKHNFIYELVQTFALYQREKQMTKEFLASDFNLGCKKITYYILHKVWIHWYHGNRSWTKLRTRTDQETSIQNQTLHWSYLWWQSTVLPLDFFLVFVFFCATKLRTKTGESWEKSPSSFDEPTTTTSCCAHTYLRVDFASKTKARS